MENISLADALQPASFHEETDEGSRLFLTPWQMVARRFFSNRMALFGMAVLIVIALFSFAGPLFYAYSESELFYIDKETGEELRTTGDSARLATSTLASLQKPSLRHILGTNRLGQDMLARLMYGGRVSLLVGFVVVFVELLLGILLGGLAGYYRGLVDSVIMRVVDIISSIPLIPLMLIMSSLLITLQISTQHKIYVTMFILGALYWTGVSRMVRGSILSLREMEFMQAADATGIRASNKIFHHLIPNMLPNLIVLATLDLGGIILLESTLSFLGVGVGAPYASWGNMVSTVNDSEIMQHFPHVWVAPGICILIVVLAFNFVGDGLRDATDPRMKGR
ncbi:MAG: ABC transporter permease [Clostridiales bacterium]|jgi:peptide/nickel transport system permease protein|nr:ABC transporter permease [Clostridiales bacterium]